MRTKLLAIITVMSLVLFAAPRAEAGWNYITLSKYYAFPGETITVNGNGFSPGENVTVTVGSLTQNTTASGNGQFTSGGFTIPNSMIGTTVSVNAQAPSGSGSANLVVGTYYPHVEPSSWYLPKGGPINFSGKHFGPNEQVTIQFQGSTLGTATADSNGSFTSQNFTVPNSGDKATYTFTGQNSHTTDSLTVSLANWGPVTTLNPYAASPPTNVTVNGQGFGASEGVNLHFNGQLWGWASTTPSGTFNFTNSVPSWATTGPNIVITVGNSTNVSGQATFMLLSPAPPMPAIQPIK